MSLPIFFRGSGAPAGLTLIEGAAYFRTDAPNGGLYIVHNGAWIGLQTALANASAVVSVNSQKITNLGTPTAGTDAATKAYVDSVAVAPTAGDSTISVTGSAIKATGNFFADNKQVHAPSFLSDDTTNQIMISGSGVFSNTLANNPGLYPGAGGTSYLNGDLGFQVHTTSKISPPLVAWTNTTHDEQLNTITITCDAGAGFVTYKVATLGSVAGPDWYGSAGDATGGNTAGGAFICEGGNKSGSGLKGGAKLCVYRTATRGDRPVVEVKEISAGVDGLGFYGTTPIARPTRAGQLTDSTTGTPSGTIADVGAAFSQSGLNNIHASLLAKINALETILHNLGLTT